MFLYTQTLNFNFEQCPYASSVLFTHFCDSRMVDVQSTRGSVKIQPESEAFSNSHNLLVVFLAALGERSILERIGSERG